MGSRSKCYQSRPLKRSIHPQRFSIRFSSLEALACLSVFELFQEQLEQRGWAVDSPYRLIGDPTVLNGHVTFTIHRTLYLPSDHFVTARLGDRITALSLRRTVVSLGDAYRRDHHPKSKLGFETYTGILEPQQHMAGMTRPPSYYLPQFKTISSDCFYYDYTKPDFVEQFNQYLNNFMER